MKTCWIVCLLLLLNACASTSSTRTTPLLPIENPNNEIAQENVSNPDATSSSIESDRIKPPIVLSKPDNQIASNDNKIAKPEWPVESGVATYYANHMEGQITASGESYNPSEFTAAHRTIPLGSQVRVTNQKNKQVVIVRINDRWGGSGDRIINLSKAAAVKLGFGTAGMLPVTLTVESIPAGNENKQFSEKKPLNSKQLPSNIAEEGSSTNHSKLRICQNEANILGLTGEFYRYHVVGCLNRQK